MSEWDSDIGALLDDVLQDKEPEATEPPVQEATPETPTPPQVQETAPPQPSEPLSSQADESAVTPASKDTTLTDLLADNEEPAAEEVTTVVNDGQEPQQKLESEGDSVQADVEKAALPPVDLTKFSTPVENEAVELPTFTTDEIMNEIDIRNFGTLVSLTNRRWHAKVKDRKAAKDAADASGADGESFEARKRLLVGADEKLRTVHKCIDAARTDHYRMTLPWSTVGVNDIGKRAGARLLPNTLFFEYAQTMGKHKAEMVDALEKFTDAYPTLIAIAQQKLGTAFNQNEYPNPTLIDQYFALEFDFEPIPSGGDYKGLQDAQVEKLAAALQRKTQKKMENAMQDAWARLLEDVQRAATALSNPDAMFHYTMFDKLAEHSTMLSHLNITGDSRIESIRTEVRDKLTKHDVKDVRKDDALRKRLGEDACSILKQMKEYADG